MALNGSHATTLPPARGTLSSSQLLSSSISSISSSTSSRQASSQISKIYRQASTLFLTRRLPESLSTILPVIQPPPPSDGSPEGNGDAAPIVRASRSTRIKVWSLYLTILNAVLELDPDEGKISFGSSEYRALVNKVRDGEVWEEIVRDGYGGIEGDVDADVVINLATLLLAHARTQKVNQTRLENYLAASTTPNLNIADRFENHDGRRSPSKSGTDTPRDLNARVKILELYSLHVLLRNNEWDYAREFITISEVLDEERREAFLQALQSLQDEQAEADRREREEQRYQEEMLRRDIEDQRRRREQEDRERRLLEERRENSKRSPSEIDFGVEDVASPSTRSAKTSSINGNGNGNAKPFTDPSNTVPSPSSSRPAPKKPLPPPARRPGAGAGSTKAPPTLVARAGNILANVKRLLDEMTGSVTSTPVSVLRTMGFIIFFLAVFGRRQVRERIRRVIGTAWTKVLQTAGMGVKVSYI